MGLKNWQVPAIIGILPYFLHLALLLFFAGMCLYIRSLYGGTLFVLMLATAASTYAAFALTHLLDYFFPSCPYKSVVVSYVLLGPGALYRFSMEMFTWIIRVIGHHELEASNSSVQTIISAAAPGIYGRKEREATAVASRNDRILADSLIWLHTEASNPSVQSIIIAATAGLPWDFDQREVEKLWRHGLDDGKVCSNIWNNRGRMVYDGLSVQNSLQSAQARALLRLYPFSRDLLAEAIDQSLALLDYASLSELIMSPFSSKLETIAVVGIYLSRRLETGISWDPLAEHNSLLDKVCVQALKAIEDQESSSAWRLIFHALGCIQDMDRRRALAVASYFLRDFSISGTILRRSSDLKSPKISQPRQVHCTFQEVRDSGEFTFHSVILNNIIWRARFTFGFPVFYSIGLPPVPYGSSIHTVMPAVVSFMKSCSREILPESSWHFIFSLDFLSPQIYDRGRDSRMFPTGVRVFSQIDVATIWARVFCFVLFEGGIFNQDLSLLDIEDYAAIGYLTSFWLHTQVSTESELERAKVEVIIRHCGKMIQQRDPIHTLYAMHAVRLYPTNIIAMIFSHLVNHRTMWDSAMDQDIFLLYKWLIGKWESIPLYSYEMAMDRCCTVCALHFHTFSFAAEENIALQKDFHTFIGAAKEIIEEAQGVFIPLVGVFNGPFLQQRMSPAQRLLSANYLFELMVGLLGLQQAIDSGVKIYIYEGNEK
jgi:hypothetical protein